METEGTGMSYGITNWWPAGSTVALEGTFTKDAVGTDGILQIDLASDDDEAILMYGVIVMGATRAGGADDVTVQYNNTSGTTLAKIDVVSMNASEALYLPTAFADAAVAVDNAIGMRDFHSLLLSSGDELYIKVAGMANTETFVVRLRFRVRWGSEFTTTPGAGAFA
jgi:hypothetical protein